ncbi:hypothetical protein LCGC14_0500240 [marine sediment metagenome]|uniref:Uncharacterized protein n=1 Tax=marine sediment metagenome TaxID=412755 RepID=A0A0F9UQZ4_9ZZZZ
MTETEVTINASDVAVSVTTHARLGASEWQVRLWLGWQFVMLAARILAHGVTLGFGEDEGRTDV